MDNKTKEYLLKKVQEMRVKVKRIKKFSAKNGWKEFRANVNKPKYNT